MRYPIYEMIKGVLFVAGVGVAQLVTNAMVSIYYNMIMAWALFYLVASFTSDLPWTDCDNTWNSAGKYIKKKNFIYFFYIFFDQSKPPQ